MKSRVGLIGLGLMGLPMGRNLLKSGFPLTVWNRTRPKTEALEKEGAKVADSPREVTAASDVTFTIVSDPPALEQVLWGEQGALAGLRKGSVLIDSSTVSPALARRIAEVCAERGADFLDAPVTGGTWGAEKGELVFMIGGNKEILDRVEPVLHAVGKRFFLLGPNGSGQTVKLAMNLILALEVQALAEGLELVARAGVAGERLIEVLQSSMGGAPVLDVKAPAILKRDFTPSFPLRLMLKDIGLAMELAKENGLRLPAGAAAHEAYSAVKAAAKTDVDYAAIANYWQKA
ncbi:MAG TPA: NAD(P)-dependent oxidoreductase [Candidatus Dormibacteraeota bacterium]|nr:NAD(P)-dependent oxidoreductase [Candidatus Dormibacteraeota bacterium]